MVRPGEVQPMKLEWIALDDIGPLMQSDDWVADQKADGVHVMARLGSGRVDFVGVGGGHLTHAASALHFPRLREELLPLAQRDLVLDGELIPSTGTYWLYDMPLLQGDPPLLPEDQLRTRRQALEQLVAHWPEEARPSIRLLPQARTTDEKVSLLRRVHDTVAEGIVLKRLDQPYEPGRRVKHWLKVKLYRECDAVVTELRPGGANSCRLGVYGPNGLVPIGSSSLIGKPSCDVGDVLEVKFLYWTGEAIYQPTILRRREDKRPEDCRIEQFVPVSREILT